LAPASGRVTPITTAEGSGAVFTGTSLALAAPPEERAQLCGRAPR